MTTEYELAPDRRRKRNPKVAEGRAPSLSSGLRPLSASRTKERLKWPTDGRERAVELAPDPVSWWKRWAR